MGVFQNKIVQILIFTLLPPILAFTIAYSTMGKQYPWYNEISRPEWNPPDWIFGPVWTILYLLMGYASFRVWDEGDGFSGRARVPLIVFFIHLIINLTWTPVFFYFHQIGLATIHIFILWVFILLTTFLFYQVEKIAAYLMIPYICWVSFASILCFTIWRLNA